MNIQKYEAFLKTVEYGSLTKAAQVLGYTQSAISHMLNALESEWGVTLLLRDRSGVCITSNGLQLLPIVRNVCNANRELISKVRELHGLESGTIRIGTFTSVSVNWLPNMIKNFNRKYPNINFELLHGDYNQIENWVMEGRADCGFLRLPPRADLESIFLEQDRLMVILPEQHPLADYEFFPIKKLTEEPFILVEAGPINEISEIFERNHIRPNVRFTAKEDFAIISMVESGLGISILPELVLNRTPYKIIKKELEKPAYRKLGIVLKDTNHASPAVKGFLDFLHHS
ncbi:DNA-binding transcriptional regulator, LysR family [Desulfotomaculum arcticum]|uniref:DNA-binding transcriptional regulator, LysR family n=1 Tax=Desulfotruncus arcticus DSM 17038 TaxID=1121424 RepID=A0A1I2P5Y6_9FIRM|nr:LysR family transcriptional regulator [Desulfotruncus arcticus]SFG09377.1 DNA-binding transcriptional regulator, LysR family [Desulfotomaculum arcticum] [Desulfotruncus arcticus DSM 17038]